MLNTDMFEQLETLKSFVGEPSFPFFPLSLPCLSLENTGGIFRDLGYNLALTLPFGVLVFLGQGDLG